VSQPKLPRWPWAISAIGALLLASSFVRLPARSSRIDPAWLAPDRTHVFRVGLGALGTTSDWDKAIIREDGQALRRCGDLTRVLREPGLFGTWGADLYFGSKDLSDPRSNGRAYSLEAPGLPISAWLARPTPLASREIISAVGLLLLWIHPLRRRVGVLEAVVGPGLIRFSPLDLRIVLRILIGLCAWRWLSTDYGALPRLVRGHTTIFPHDTGPIDAIANALETHVFDRPEKILPWQIGTAVLLVAAMVRLSRPILTCALIPFLLTEWVAYRYRFSLGDLEIPAAVVTLAGLWPRSWSTTLRDGGARITPQATELGACLTLYIGCSYFLCGLCKLELEGSWFNRVHLELMYTSMVVWVGWSGPPWLDTLARGFGQVFAIPPIAFASAVACVTVELLWSVALVSRRGRVLLPGAMFGAHVLIFLSSGICFLPWAIAGVVCVIPWRDLVSPMKVDCRGDGSRTARIVELILRLDWLRKLETTALVPAGPASTLTVSDPNGTYTGRDALLRVALRCWLLAPFVAAARIVWPTSAPPPEPLNDERDIATSASVRLAFAVVTCVLLSVCPYIHRTFVFPFIRCGPDFVYESLAGRGQVYRLGYRKTPQTTFAPFPFNQGGFFDYRLTAMQDQYIRQFLDGDEPTRSSARSILWQLQRAARPYQSSRHLLGPLACPAHVIGTSDEASEAALEDLHMLRGDYEVIEGIPRIEWTDLGPAPRPPG
jgi:hypothetical protein